MHEEARVVHTDLKPENILIRDESMLVEMAPVKVLPRQYLQRSFTIPGSRRQRVSAEFHEQLEAGDAKFLYLNEPDSVLIDLGGASSLRDNC